jgi:hypothetical protein
MHKKKTICRYSNKNSVVSRNNLKQVKTKIKMLTMFSHLGPQIEGMPYILHKGWVT